ncbi:MAG: N-methyl-L-tryptophan oxidase [Planctomycetota bacterium]
MAAQYHTIIIGAGGIGSAAAFELARRGHRVLALDRFAPPHTHGSTHGETRAIRLAYFEHPDYVPLLRRAYELWSDVERLGGEPLFERVGLLQVGREDGEVCGGVLRSARQHNLAVETLTPREVEQRFPGLRVPMTDVVGLVERDAGYLHVERCVRTFLRLAVAAGAEVRTGATVSAIEPQHDGSFVVRVGDEHLRAAHLAVCAGPWSARLPGMPALGLSLRRKMLVWYPLHEAHDPRYATDGRCPVFLYELPGGPAGGGEHGKVFYGFPSQDGATLKIGEHSGGTSLDDPAALDTSLRADDRAGLESFLRAHLPGVNADATPARHEACIYTMSKDGHFYVGRHPQHPRMAFVAGLSGHGYKFATVLGEVLADLVTGVAPRVPLGAFAIDR